MIRYQDELVTVIEGDCAEVLPTLGPFDLLLTDPNYGIGAARYERANSQHGKSLAVCNDYGSNDWDDEPASQPLLDKAVASSTNAIVWGGNYFSLPPSSCWLVWDKDNGTNDYADCELAWTNLKGAVRKFKHRWHGMLQENMGDKKEHRVHPTQKPLALMRWCIKQAPDGIKSILDPFGGSLTTAIAARREGIKCTVIEREPKYIEAGIKRLQNEPVEMLF